MLVYNSSQSILIEMAVGSELRQKKLSILKTTIIACTKAEQQKLTSCVQKY